MTLTPSAPSSSKILSGPHWGWRRAVATIKSRTRSSAGGRVQGHRTYRPRPLGGPAAVLSRHGPSPLRASCRLAAGQPEGSIFFNIRSRVDRDPEMPQARDAIRGEMPVLLKEWRVRTLRSGPCCAHLCPARGREVTSRDRLTHGDENRSRLMTGFPADRGKRRPARAPPAGTTSGLFAGEPTKDSRTCWSRPSWLTIAAAGCACAARRARPRRRPGRNRGRKPEAARHGIMAKPDGPVHTRPGPGGLCRTWRLLCSACA